MIADSLAVASQVRRQLDNSLWTFACSLQYFCQNFGSFGCSLFVLLGSFFVRRSQHFKVTSKFTFRISSKLQLQNFDQTQPKNIVLNPAPKCPRSFVCVGMISKKMSALLLECSERTNISLMSLWSVKMVSSWRLTRSSWLRLALSFRRYLRETNTPTHCTIG